jgi:2-hydroxy-6-oxonona-2,4-dienedioate hydrolase
VVLDLTELADWLSDWMAAFGLQRGSLLGNSFGCQVIADLAARYPDRARMRFCRDRQRRLMSPPGVGSSSRWRQNQRYNPSSLRDVTNADYKKCGFRRMYWSFQQQLTDRIEDKAPKIHASALVVSRRARPDCQSAVVRGYRPYVPARPSRDNSRGRTHLCYTAPIQLADVTRSFVNEAKDLKL